jgi:benzoate/toluate 1,2-dioxygenase reductase subunit
MTHRPMPFHIALNFEDGATRIITCNAGETVLKAAYRQQVNLPMDCSDGVCGTCKCRAESGEYQQGEDYIEDALSEDEAAEGKVLTCQMVPSSDCVIAVPVPSSACKLKPATLAPPSHGWIRSLPVQSCSNWRWKAARGGFPRRPICQSRHSR